MKKLLFFLLVFFFTVSLFTHCNNATQQTGNKALMYSVDVTKSWKLGVQMWTFHYFDFTTALNKVDSAGIKFIEAIPGQPLGGGMKDSFGISMSADSRAKLKMILQSKGISIVAMGVISPSSVDEW